MDNDDLALREAVVGYLEWIWGMEWPVLAVAYRATELKYQDCTSSCLSSRCKY